MPTSKPPNSSLQLPEEALSGGAGAYFESIDPAYRRPLCIVVLKLLASQREACADDGQMLMALARMERTIAPFLSHTGGIGPVQQVWGRPPEEMKP